MKALRLVAMLSVFALGFVIFSRAQGPINPGSETVARPKKGSSGAPAEAEQPKIPSKFSKKDPTSTSLDSPVFHTDATTVTVDVSVLDNKGHFIPKIGKEHFRVLEDNVPQQISGYSLGEAPMTVAMVVEFSNRYQSFYSETWYQTLAAAYGFAETMKPEDYLAIVAYDLRTEMLSDFTTNRAETQDALLRLRYPGFSESNLFDALVDTAQRMQGIEGRKAIVLISTGMDTFSKLNFDKTRKAIQEAGVPIYSIGLMQAIRAVATAGGYLSGVQELDFLQADNQLRTFSKESGGMSFFPHFYGEFPGIFQAVSQSLRSQYVLTYNPTNTARDGKFRKIKVELVDPETNQPLKVVDEKKKPIKYQVIAKAGYTAPRAVE
jgi:Ca-activated chloride channel family protein